MLLYFIILLLILSYVWLKHRYTYWERLGVKGPKPMFFFGNLFKSLTLQEHVSIAHSEWYNKFNDVPYIGFYKLLKPAIMIRDTELQREILVKSFMNFHENDADVSDEDDLRKTSSFFLNGEKWQRSRAIFGSLFSANKLRQVFPCMLQVGREWEKYVCSLGENAQVDGKDICSRYTIETMIRCTFSIDGKSFEPKSEFIDMGKTFLTPEPVTAMKMMTSFVIQEILKLFTLNTTPWVSNRFKKIVHDQTKVRDSGSVRCDDVLQTILNSREKFELTEVEIAGNCFMIFFEACDTTPNILTLALYQLAQNSDIQDKLARSIESSIAANDDNVTYDLIHKHEYLEKVLYESIRCQPSFFGLLKLCTKDYTLPLVPGQLPVTIPAKTPIVLPFAAVFRDPKFFPNPEAFDPERFSPEQKALRPKSAFMLFGDGPRMCIGMTLGLFNIKMGLFEIIRYFDVRLAPNKKPFELHPMSFALVPKNGIKLIFTSRKKTT